MDKYERKGPTLKMTQRRNKGTEVEDNQGVEGCLGMTYCWTPDRSPESLGKLETIPKAETPWSDSPTCLLSFAYLLVFDAAVTVGRRRIPHKVCGALGCT